MSKISIVQSGLDLVLGRLEGGKAKETDNVDHLIFSDAYSTSYNDLDKVTGGLRSGLIIVAGRTLHGADTLHRCLVEPILFESGAKVLFFNTSMSEENLYIHLCSSLSRVDRQSILKSSLDSEGWSRVSSSLGLLRETESLLTVNEPFLYLEDIESTCDEAINQYGALPVIAIDSLQAIRTRKSYDNRYTETAEITRTLKALSVKYNSRIVVKSHLNRNLEQRVDKRPVLNDLRDSGTIEDDASLVIFTYIESVYNSELAYDNGNVSLMEAIVAKNDNSKLGTVTLVHSKHYSRVDSYVRE